MPILSRSWNAGEEMAGPVLFDGAQAESGMDQAWPIRPGRGLSGDRAGLFETCANPSCASGWLHLWRSRSVPIFEGGWSCSEACTAACVAAAVARELEGGGSSQENHRHRIPLGLVMLEQGRITSSQLRQALGVQKAAGGGRLGHWLVRQQGVSEQLVTRALGLQWSCPVLPMELHDAEALTALVPRLFVDAFGVLPLRVAAGKFLYLAFEDRLDPVLALAVERMTGLRVESGLVQGSLFGAAHSRMLNSQFPPGGIAGGKLGAGAGPDAGKSNREGAPGRVAVGPGPRLPVAADVAARAEWSAAGCRFGPRPDLFHPSAL